MIEVAAGLAIADKTVKTVRGVLGLLKDTRDAVKQDNPDVAEKLGEVREAINETLDQLIDLKAQHFELLQQNIELQKANDIQSQFTYANVARRGTSIAYVPIEPEKHPEGLMLCPICADKGSKVPLSVSKTDSYAHCGSCKNSIEINGHTPPGRRRVIGV